MNKYYSLILLTIALFSYEALAEYNFTLSPAELSNKFEIAHEARDYDAITELVHWDGVRKPMRKKIEVYTTATFGLKINKILIEKVNNSKFQKHLIGGKELEPNLPVSHIMKVHFDVNEKPNSDKIKNTVVFLLGKKEIDYMVSDYMMAIYVEVKGSSNNSH